MVTIGSIRAAERHSLAGGPFGSDLTTRDYVTEGVPVIRGNNLPDDRMFHDDDFAYVSAEKAARLAANSAGPGDVVFTQRGTLGQIGIIPNSSQHRRYIISQSQMKLTVDRTSTDPRFLYYFFRSPDAVQTIKSRAISSGVPHINLGIIREFEVPAPPLRVQQRIVDLLAAYDDLIENNRRRMALLEAAARQIYQEWFVRLRFPGHERTSFRKGMPQGWERRPLGSCARFLSGGTPSKARADFWEGDIPWVSSGELTTMRIHRTTLNVTAGAVVSGSRLVPPETILAVVRGMSLAKEFRLSLTARTVAFNQDLKAIVSEPDIDTLLLFHSLDAQRDQIRDKAGDSSHGTKKLDTPVLSEVPIIVPPDAMQRRFRESVVWQHTQWDNLDEQNQRLRAARDLLLPRLMSGEIIP